MAEEARDDEKDEGDVPGAITFAEIFGIIILIYLFARILGNLGTAGGTHGNFFSTISVYGFFDRFGLGDVFTSTVSTYIFLISILSMLFILGIIYTLIRLHALEKIWQAMINPIPESEAIAAPKNERWQRVVAHINSTNPSDWRLSILECDIILDELLDKLGYLGGTIGDKLKNAEPGDFRTLNNAWEAHKIRNAIAHEGQDFTLTEREARRIVGLYETVFREFDFI